MKKKNMLKPIPKEELDEFTKKYTEEQKMREYERERKKLSDKEELMARNEQLPKSDTYAYQKIIEEEKNRKDAKEKEKLDKIYKNMKIKQFSKVVHSEMLPQIDLEKKKELQERIKKMKARPEKHKKTKRNRIIMRKRDPTKPSKYKWKLKLDISMDRLENKNKSKSRVSPRLNYSSISSHIRNSLNDDLITDEDKKNLLNKSRSKSAEKRKPLEKAPDYLTEMRIKKNIDLSNSTEKEKEKQSFINYFIFRRSKKMA